MRRNEKTIATSLAAKGPSIGREKERRLLVLPQLTKQQHCEFPHPWRSLVAVR